MTSRNRAMKALSAAVKELRSPPSKVACEILSEIEEEDRRLTERELAEARIERADSAFTDMSTKRKVLLPRIRPLETAALEAAVEDIENLVEQLRSEAEGLWKKDEDLDHPGVTAERMIAAGHRLEALASFELRSEGHRLGDAAQRVLDLCGRTLEATLKEKTSSVLPEWPKAMQELRELIRARNEAPAPGPDGPRPS